MILAMTAMPFLALALRLIMTLSPSHDWVTFRYPTDEGVVWVETCLEMEGHASGEFDRSWYRETCWPPLFSGEQRFLPPDTIHIRARLFYRLHGENQDPLWTPVMQVRPE